MDSVAEEDTRDHPLTSTSTCMYTCQYMHLHTCALTFTSVHALIKRGSILIKEGRAGQMSFRGNKEAGTTLRLPWPLCKEETAAWANVVIQSQ